MLGSYTTLGEITASDAAKGIRIGGFSVAAVALTIAAALLYAKYRIAIVGGKLVIKGVNKVRGKD